MKYVSLYGCRWRQYSVVVAAENRADAREIFNAWVASREGTALELSFTDVRITRTKTPGDRLIITR